jgi:hypothetical protein
MGKNPTLYCVAWPAPGSSAIRKLGRLRTLYLGPCLEAYNCLFLIGRRSIASLALFRGPTLRDSLLGYLCIVDGAGNIGSRTKRSRDTAKVRDRGSFRLIMLLLWLALGLDFALSCLLPQATILWKRTWLFFIGIALMRRKWEAHWEKHRLLPKSL